MIETGRSFKQRPFRKASQRQCLEEYSQTNDGLVRKRYVTLTVTLNNFPFSCIFYVGNTRVISQTALDHFRTSLSTKANDPYSVLLRRNKLPMALLDDAANPHSQKVR